MAKRSTDKMTQNLYDALKQFGTKREADAGRRIEAMGPEAVERLLQMLEQETRKRKVINGVIVAGLVAYVAVCICLERVWHYALFWTKHPTSFFIMNGLAALMGASHFHNHVTRALSRVDDVRAVGPLLQALRVSKIHQDSVIRTLTRLLPRMKATDAHLLNDEQRTSLYKVLKGNPRKHSALAVSALKALEQIGTAEALPLVERLAKGPDGTLKEEEVVQAARTCLPFLRERAELDRDQKTLLRATVGEDDGATTLLRPASGVAAPSEVALLRPSDEG
jgi:hypothetical protein